MNFQVELHNFCNFTCGYCPHKDMVREQEFMSDEVWNTILMRYIVPYRTINSFSPPTFIGHKDTEPLINKKLPSRLLGIATEAPDMKIDIYSNGVLLPMWRDRGQDFIDFLGSLPNQVRLMISYHPRNHDDSVNDYAEMVKYLSHILLAPPPNIEFITVSHKSKWVSEDMQESWRLTWAGLPITVHSNCSINPWTGRMKEVATCEYHGCPYSDFGHWFFGASGNIIACCLDLEEEIVLGNVLKDDPAEMFLKTEAFYAEQRRTLANKAAVNHQVCADCFGQVRQPASQELITLGTRSA